MEGENSNFRSAEERQAAVEFNVNQEQEGSELMNYLKDSEMALREMKARFDELTNGARPEPGTGEGAEYKISQAIDDLQLNMRTYRLERGDQRV